MILRRALDRAREFGGFLMNFLQFLIGVIHGAFKRAELGMPVLELFPTLSAPHLQHQSKESESWSKNPPNKYENKGLIEILFAHFL